MVMIKFQFLGRWRRDETGLLYPSVSRGLWIIFRHWYYKEVECRPVAGGCKCGSVPSTNLDERSGNLRNINDRQADQPTNNVRHLAASAYCHCWTAVVRINSFSNMYVQYATCKIFVECYSVHYVIKALFTLMYTSYIYIYTQYMYNGAYVRTFTPTGSCCTYWVHGLATGLVLCFSVFVPAYQITRCHNAE